MRFSDGRRLRPPANVTAVALGDPDPGRLERSEKQRATLTGANDGLGPPPLPDQAISEDVLAMGCRLGVPTASLHYGVPAAVLGPAVRRARLADPTQYARAPISYSCFLLRQY